MRPVLKLLGVAGSLALLVSAAVPVSASHYGDGPSRARSYINPDTGAATANPDVARGSSCASPDTYDVQPVSAPGKADRNVHNDACLFRSDGSAFDGRVTWERRGVGTISACPDPDGSGPRTARTVDVTGDGVADWCQQTGYQLKGTAGDREYHVRVDSTRAGDQSVTFCYDPDRNGCSDESVKARIAVRWIAPATAPTYINPDLNTDHPNESVLRDSSCRYQDRDDVQPLSTPGTSDRNVHNDACLFTAGYTPVDTRATFESRGVGEILACPDPDGSGPRTATASDTNGDLRTDRCTQSGYQAKGTAGDREFHVRLNNDAAPGHQTVTFCYDPDGDGCADERVKSSIRIEWTSGVAYAVASPAGTIAL